MSTPQSNDQTLTNAKIRIITNSDIRYEGILFKINPDEKTITLKNVKGFGTENRRPEKKVPASELMYEYIVFRSIEIKDLIVLKDEEITEKTTSEPKKEEPKIETKKVQNQDTRQPRNDKPEERSNQTKEHREHREPRDNRQVNRSDQRHNDAYQKRDTRPEVPLKSSQGFQFDKMVNALSDFEKSKLLTSKKYESKYENDDFFDSISSSVGNDRKKEIESFNDRRVDKDTFGIMPKVHFSNNYRGNNDRRGNNSHSGNFTKSQPENSNHRKDNNDDFKKRNNDKRYKNQREDEYEYVRKET